MGKGQGQDTYYMVAVPPARRSHLMVDDQVFFFGAVEAVSAGEFTLQRPEEPLGPDQELTPGASYDAVMYLGQQAEEIPLALRFTVEKVDQAILCRILEIDPRAQEMLHRFVHQIQVDQRREQFEQSVDLVQVKHDD